MHPFYEPNRRLLHNRDTRAEGLISMIAYLLFWAAAVPVAIRALKRYSAPPASGDAEHDPAIAVLRIRLARGEIDVDEYHQRIDALRAKRPD